MTGQNNHINDKHIRDLLKWRLLEQVEDDVLTQKLIDMEAKLAFSTEALLLPSLQKEKELLQKLSGTKGKKAFFKWVFPALAVVLISALAVFLFNPPEIAQLQKTIVKPVAIQNNDLLVDQTNIVSFTEPSAPAASTISIGKPEKNLDVVFADTTRNEKEEKWTAGDAGIKVDYKAGPPKKNVVYIDPYEHIPVLSEKDREYTKKMKEKMIKSIMKRDQNVWSYVPASTEMIYGDKVSVAGFYISGTEVTNNNYRIFLNDLIIQDRIDDFLKAVPDTAKWMITEKKFEGRKFGEPMRKNYFWHPAYNDYPVVNVSREAAKMYCDWLTISVNEKIKATASKEKADALYINDLRIPAEEEWIIAARGGAGDVAYPWSNVPQRKGIQTEKGCYLCNFSIISYPDSLKKMNQCANSKIPNAITAAGSVSNDFFCTAKVNSYNPNGYRVYCTSGNVSEMVWQYKTNKPCAKGGSWASDADEVKIGAEPELINVTEGSPYLGFRPVFTARNK